MWGGLSPVPPPRAKTPPQGCEGFVRASGLVVRRGDVVQPERLPLPRPGPAVHLQGLRILHVLDRPPESLLAAVGGLPSLTQLGRHDLATSGQRLADERLGPAPRG